MSALFVVHKHDATNLHYDFRIECDGVLKSWAVPKELPKRAGVKRLAIQTEDHDLSYADFQGTIPEGEYGAGTVEIWDKGTFENITKEKGVRVPLSRAIENGKVELLLSGKKLKNGYALIRTSFKKKGDDGNYWLLLKMKKQTVQKKDNEA